MKNEDNEIEQVSTDLVLPPDASLALVAERLAEQARHDQVSLTGEGGLLTGLVQQVLQSALETEMTDHVGYEQHSSGGWGSGNSRTATTRKRSRPRLVTSSSIFHATATAASSRKQCRSGHDGCRVSTNKSSRCMPKA